MIRSAFLLRMVRFEVEFTLNHSLQSDGDNSSFRISLVTRQAQVLTTGWPRR